MVAGDEVRFTTVHNRRIKVVLQPHKTRTRELHLPEISSRGSERRSASVCSLRKDDDPMGSTGRLGGGFRQQAQKMSSALTQTSEELAQALRQFRDHVIMWSGSFEAGMAGCAPLEVIEVERQRMTTRLDELEQQLTTQRADFGERECLSCIRRTNQEPSTDSSVFLTDGSPARSLTDSSAGRSQGSYLGRSLTDSSAGRSPGLYRSTPVGLQVQLSQALSDDETSGAARLDACLSTLRDVSENLGPFKGLTQTICEQVRELTFDKAYGHDPLSGCVLEKLAAAQRSLVDNGHRLKQLSSNLERVTVPPGRVLARDFDIKDLQEISESRRQQLKGLDSSGMEEYVPTDKPLPHAVTAQLAVASNKKSDKRLDRLEHCALELAELARSHEALQRIRENATPLHMLSSMRLALLAADRRPKPIQFVIDRLAKDIKSNIQEADLTAAPPALTQVLTHFFELISRDDFGSLVLGEDPTTGEMLYSITDRFDYSSIELISSLDSIFNQAIAEMAEVTSKREVAFLTAKAQADQRTIEQLQKQLSSSALHVDDLHLRIKSLDSVTKSLKKDLKLAAKGVFRERLDLHSFKEINEEEERLRKSEAAVHKAKHSGKHKGSWREVLLKSQDEDPQCTLDSATYKLDKLEVECDSKTPRCCAAVDELTMLELFDWGFRSDGRAAEEPTARRGCVCARQEGLEGMYDILVRSAAG
eukprot:TRINITY_DN2292_c0_g1_i8.p1 TRINITY_DN2292_c0_g1~~TRINITY_DN2292_c0_g1_i8.p1  ORF type:complete len:704 (+),score=181.68 TRINITY_DN2292_c0_g1_i8:80-2191(+)